MLCTDKEIIKQVKGWNFGFICVNPNAGYKKSHREIKLKHLISKEIILCRYDVAKINNVYFPKYENLKAIKKLNQLKFGWVCLDSWIEEKSRYRMAKIKHSISKEIIICKYSHAKENNIKFLNFYIKSKNLNAKNKLNKLKHGWICLETYIHNKKRIAVLKHSISKEIITCQYGSAKKNLVRFPKYENLKAVRKLNSLKKDWICINSWINKNNLRLVKLKHLVSKEKVTCHFKHAKNDEIRFPKYEDIKVKKELNNLKYGWTCLDTYMSKNIRMVKLKHDLSKEQLVTYYQAAKKNKVRFPKYENLKHIKKLNNLNFGYRCLSTWISRKNKSLRMVKLQHLISKEVIVCHLENAKKNQIRFPKYQKSEYIKKITALKDGCICLNTWISKSGVRKVKLKHSISKETVICTVRNSKNFSVFFPKYADIKRLRKVNKIGLKANPQYIGISASKKDKNGHPLVLIKRKDGIGKIKKIKYKSLTNGCNPYNESQNRIEVTKIQPQYETLFKKLKIDYVKEFSLGKKRIDFVFKINNKKYGLEVKQSDKWHSDKNQIDNYKKLAKLKKYRLERIILSDPKGKHEGSISIKELEINLKKLILLR